MSKFIPNKEYSHIALIFCFHLRKSAAESYWLLREADDERAPSQATCKRLFRRFKSGDFDTRQQERRRTAKKFEDAKLQELLNEDDSQTKKQLAEQLSVSQQTVFNRLREVGKIQKTDRWVPCELNATKMKKRKNMWHFAHSVQKEVLFASYSYIWWKEDLFCESQAQKIMGRPGRIIHIDRKIESLWQKDDGLCLVGPETWFGGNDC